MSRQLSTYQFIEKANKIHNFKYNYEKTKYVHNRLKVIITCQIHGDFEQTACSHLYGYGCSKCGDILGRSKRNSNKDEFIKKAINIHGSLYNYESVDYNSNKIHVTINCPKHGNFKMRPDNHLSGRGCYKCGRALTGEKIANNNYNTFSKTEWSNLSNGRNCTFYILKCSKDNEIFFKLGITLSSVKRRYSSRKRMPYEYETFKTIQSYNPEKIWDLEKACKKAILKDRYTPLYPFGGSSTECFEKYEQIKEIVENYEN